jgi:hypothetical protein
MSIEDQERKVSSLLKRSATLAETAERLWDEWAASDNRAVKAYEEWDREFKLLHKMERSDDNE